jgi:YidB-like protein
MTNSSTGGLTGFMDKFKGAGLGELASSWLGGGGNAQAISTSQVESLFGGSGGLLGMITSKLGIGGSAASSALSFLLPAVIGKLTPGGSIPASMPSDVMGFIGGAKDMLGAGAASMAGGAAATAGAAKAAGGGLMKWLPWVIAAAVGAFVLSQCTRETEALKAAAPKASAVVAPAPAPAATAPAFVAAPVAPAAPVAEIAIPTGAGVIAQVINGIPIVKVFFSMPANPMCRVNS